MKNFTPVMRFIATSDVHYKDEPTVERERMEKAIVNTYKYSENHPTYKKLDAIAVVGDFANKGTPTQMQCFKDSLDKLLKEETKVIISIASHEFGFDGEEGAIKRLKEIFGSEPDNHEVINGFHFISTSTTKGTRFSKEKIDWMGEKLKIAAAEDRKKPIFVFQHPHPTSTVYGSILWGEDEFIPTLMNYPQVIDFSGHSHAPINDPRSIHQKHFTSLGTGTMSYFELDEFDKVYGTVPPNSKEAAQLLIVEVDKDNRVRIMPYDVITENFFPQVWKIDEPSNPDSFIYTDDRYRTDLKPYFKDNTKIEVTEIDETSCNLTFEQAEIENRDIETEYVNGYDITLRYKDNGFIAKKFSIWSEYYFYNMPESLSHKIEDLSPETEYEVTVKANSFWRTVSDNALTYSFKTK